MDALHLIDRFRVEKQWTWTKLATELELSPCYFSNLKLGGRRPRQEVVNQLADMLDEAGLFAGALEKLQFKDSLNNLHLSAA